MEENSSFRIRCYLCGQNDIQSLFSLHNSLELLLGNMYGRKCLKCYVKHLCVFK